MPFVPFVSGKTFAIYGAKRFNLSSASFTFSSLSGESFIALSYFSMFGFIQNTSSVAISLFTNGYSACNAPISFILFPPYILVAHHIINYN
ncbi:Uncharacterised protein [Streptococcus pneumoniae]|nr:Uncharacterised protein [Streptococcus pneumoniae]